MLKYFRSFTWAGSLSFVSRTLFFVTVTMCKKWIIWKTEKKKSMGRKWRGATLSPITCPLSVEHRILWFEIEPLISCSTIYICNTCPYAIHDCATSWDGDVACSASIPPLCCSEISLLDACGCPSNTPVGMTATCFGWEVPFWIVWISLEALGTVMLSANGNGWTVNVQLGGSVASPSRMKGKSISFV